MPTEPKPTKETRYERPDRVGKQIGEPCDHVEDYDGDETKLPVWGDGKVNRPRAEMQALRMKFERWYAKPIRRRVPPTQKAWAAENGVHEVTTSAWVKDYKRDRNLEPKNVLKKKSDQELQDLLKSYTAKPEKRTEVEQEIEWRKLKTEKMRFIEEYCWMTLQEGGDPVPFELWDCQREALVDFDRYQHLIVLKTRRLGLSWLADAYCLHTCLFVDNVNILFRSIGREEATEQHERLKFMYDHLPEWMKERVQLGKTTGMKLKRNDSISQMSNGSAIRMLASTARKGHGSTPKILFWDEQARDVNAGKAYGGLKASLGASGKTKIIIVSTSEGPGNLFHL